MGTEWKKMANDALSRSRIYGLLSTVFRAEPSAELIEEFRGPQLSSALAELGVDLGESFREERVEDITEALVMEFTRLFVGPGHHISAHESIFSEVDGDGGLWGSKTVEVKKFIETTGLDYDPSFSGIPDHISVELEFMQKLSEWEAEQWLAKDRKGAEYGQSVQRMFLEQHLLKWLPRFCDAVIEMAEQPFYRTMAKITMNYMEFERHRYVTDNAA